MVRLLGVEHHQTFRTSSELVGSQAYNIFAFSKKGRMKTVNRNTLSEPANMEFMHEIVVN